MYVSDIINYYQASHYEIGTQEVVWNRCDEKILLLLFIILNSCYLLKEKWK